MRSRRRQGVHTAHSDAPSPTGTGRTDGRPMHQVARRREGRWLASHVPRTSTGALQPACADAEPRPLPISDTTATSAALVRKSEENVQKAGRIRELTHASAGWCASLRAASREALALAVDDGPLSGSSTQSSNIARIGDTQVVVLAWAVSLRASDCPGNDARYTGKRRLRRRAILQNYWASAFVPIN
jgi:hypothetical protein